MTAVAWRGTAAGLLVWAVAWAPGARAPRRTPATAERSGPAVFRLDVSDAQREQLTEAKRAELIAQLERLVQRFPDDSPRKPDLLFQLGEAYWEKSKTLRRAETEAAGDASKANHGPSDAARAPGDGRLCAAAQGVPQVPAPRRGALLARLRPRGRGAQRGGGGAVPAAASRLPGVALRARMPGSSSATTPSTPGTWRRPRTRTSTPRAMGSPRVRSYATYKLAWCDFNLGDFEGAREKLARVVDGSAGGTATQRDLRTEALVDLTRVYVRLDQPQEALAYFRRNTSGAEQRKLITRLANALADAGELRGALEVYRAALEAEPLAPEAAAWQQAVVRAQDGLHDREQVRAEAQRLADMVHPGTRWWTANASSPEALRAGFDAAEEGLRTLVTGYHQEAQRTGSPRTYRLAADVYRAYLSAFARDARAGVDLGPRLQHERSTRRRSPGRWATGARPPSSTSTWWTSASRTGRRPARSATSVTGPPPPTTRCSPGTAWWTPSTATPRALRPGWTRSRARAGCARAPPPRRRPPSRSPTPSGGWWRRATATPSASRTPRTCSTSGTRRRWSSSSAVRRPRRSSASPGSSPWRRTRTAPGRPRTSRCTCSSRRATGWR